jgi:hypothetical protein
VWLDRQDVQTVDRQQRRENRPRDGTADGRIRMKRYPPIEEMAPMENSQRLASRRAPFPSAFGRATRGALGAAIATAVALAAFVAIGVISWDAARGFQGVGICGALGAAAGAALSGPGSRLARVLGGGIGGVVAGYFALASGEVFPPGTLKWALGGAAYAALFSLLVATIMGGIMGSLNPRSRSSGIGDATEEEVR